MIGFLAVVAALSLALATPQRAAPTYAGRSLNDWLDDAPGLISHVSLSTGQSNSLCWATGVNTSDAFHAMGPEALPILLAKLNTPDSRLKSKFNQWAAKHAPRLVVPSPSKERTRAVVGLQHLRPWPNSVTRR